jgi:hypothetical protein
MRVYIAKSNKANPEYLLKVRDFLSKFKSVQILEYQGGSYDNTDLISSDILIVIPDLSEGIKDKRVVLGKGLYMQIDDFFTHQSIDGIFIVTGINKSGMIECSYIDEVNENGNYDETFMEVLDDCNYIKYGTVKIWDSKQTIQETVAELVLVDDNDSKYYTQQEADVLWSQYVTRKTSTSNKYKYLLIKN